MIITIQNIINSFEEPTPEVDLNMADFVFTANDEDITIYDKRKEKIIVDRMSWEDLITAIKDKPWKK